MAEYQAGMGGHAEDTIGVNGESFGVAAHTDPYTAGRTEPRRGERYVHRPNFGEQTEVRGFIIRGEAYFEPEKDGSLKPMDVVINGIDAVFAGFTGKGLPVVEYEIVEVDGEPAMVDVESEVVP